MPVNYYKKYLKYKMKYMELVGGARLEELQIKKEKGTLSPTETGELQSLINRFNLLYRKKIKTLAETEELRPLIRDRFNFLYRQKIKKPEEIIETDELQGLIGDRYNLLYRKENKTQDEIAEFKLLTSDRKQRLEGLQERFQEKEALKSSSESRFNTLSLKKKEGTLIGTEEIKEFELLTLKDLMEKAGLLTEQSIINWINTQIYTKREDLTKFKTYIEQTITSIKAYTPVQLHNLGPSQRTALDTYKTHAEAYLNKIPAAPVTNPDENGPPPPPPPSLLPQLTTKEPSTAASGSTFSFSRPSTAASGSTVSFSRPPPPPLSLSPQLTTKEPFRFSNGR